MTKQTLAKGAVGTAATFGTPIFAGVNPLQLLPWLQVISVVVGIAVGIATFISIVKKKKR